MDQFIDPNLENPPGSARGNHNPLGAGPAAPTGPAGSLPMAAALPPVDGAQTANQQVTKHSYKSAMIVFDPPDLAVMRERLFELAAPIALSEEEYETYFPHVDNIYSHRSTQHHKRKPFRSHYFDCRLRGRPAGTPKTTDPTKRPRNRKARARNLCAMKIKVTEYLSTDMLATDFSAETSPTTPQGSTAWDNAPVHAGFGVQVINTELGSDPHHPGAGGKRWFMVQRVNSGVEGEDCGHRHTLAESDRIKKNSIELYKQKQIKAQKQAIAQSKAAAKASNQSSRSGSSIPILAESPQIDNMTLILYGNLSDPFVQQVWIALELKGVPYRLAEVDPANKPQDVRNASSEGIIPVIQQGDFGIAKSTAILEFLDDEFQPKILSGNARQKAWCRRWAEHVNGKIVPAYYELIRSQASIELRQKFNNELQNLLNAADPVGPFFQGAEIGYVDIMLAPWVIRASRVLERFREVAAPQAGTRWAALVEAIETCPQVRATVSQNERYVAEYHRFLKDAAAGVPMFEADLGYSLP